MALSLLTELALTYLADLAKRASAYGKQVILNLVKWIWDSLDVVTKKEVVGHLCQK